MTPRRFINILTLFFCLFGIWQIGSWHFSFPKAKKAEYQRKKTPYDEYIVYVNQVRQTIARQMFEEMGLVCTGNEGRMHEKVEEMGLQFKAYRHATIEEARALHMFVLEKLIEAVNAHETLQPFLEDRPFTDKRVTADIIFQGPGRDCFEGNVARVFNVADLMGNKSRLCYFSDDPFTEKHTKFFEEPYETAAELAKATPLQNLAVHQTNPLEEIVDEILPVFVKKMGEEHGLRCYSIGGKLTNFVEEIGVSFSVVKHASQEQARKSILTVTESLLEALNGNEKLRPYLKESPFPAERIKMRIRFTKSNGYSYSDGSMESVTIEGKEVSYFQRLPPGLTVYPIDVPLFAKESYQQAKECSSKKI